MCVECEILFTGFIYFYGHHFIAYATACALNVKDNQDYFKYATDSNIKCTSIYLWHDANGFSLFGYWATLKKLRSNRLHQKVQDI